MFGNIGMGELIIIAGIALIVIGPEKFPEFAKIALRAYRDLRGYVDDIKSEMANEIKPVKQELSKLSSYNPEEYLENVTKLVSALDTSEQPKKEDSTKIEEPAASTSDTPPGDWSGHDPYETPKQETTTPVESAPTTAEATPSSKPTAYEEAAAQTQSATTTSKETAD
jgi:Tat protein translocase TatB subunit